MSRSKTEEVLLGMLRESTGCHMLDSGGESGRAWQRNGGRDLEGEAEAVVSFAYGSIEVAHRLYHWLRMRLHFDEEATDAFFGPFMEEIDVDEATSWGELREKFPAWFARWMSAADREVDDDGEATCAGFEIEFAREPYAATGIYGDGDPVTVNSYNEPSLLDQVVLFTYFELRTRPGRSGHVESYVVLQVHGGADVRGGYTRPRVFTLSDKDDLAIFDFRRGTIVCGGDPQHCWTTDDGSHWYSEGSCGGDAGPKLETYEVLPACGANAPNVEKVNAIRLMDDGTGTCPLCARPLAACIV